MALPTFGVRDLHGPSEVGLVTITAPQYDSTLKSYPSSALNYLDPDDGETITVGSALELQQRLEEPTQPKRLTRRRTASVASITETDQKIHIFDIQRTAENLTVWRDHAAYTSKPSVTQSPSSLRGEHSIKSADPVSSTRIETTIQPATPSKNILSTEVSSTDSSKNILDDLDDVLQTACRGLEAHIGGFASFLDITAAALQHAAQRTRDADTTPVETLLSGLKNVLVEAKQVGIELIQEIDSHINPPPPKADATVHDTVAPVSPMNKAQSKIQNTDTAGPVSPINKTESKVPTTETTGPVSPIVEPTSESDSASRKVSFTLVKETKPIYASTFKRPRDPIFGSGSVIENAFKPAVPEAKPMPYRSFPNRPAPSVQSLIAPPVAQPDREQSLMDEDSSSAEFIARFPPLASLKRARTIGALRRESKQDEQPSLNGSAKAALTRYPSIGQLESRRTGADTLQSRHWRRLSASKPPSANGQDSIKDRSLRGYRKPTVQEDPEAQLGTKNPSNSNVQGSAEGPLPGAWPERSTVAPDAALYESSAEFFDRMIADAKSTVKSPILSCRNTGPPEDFFALPTNTLRRAQTVTASNPAARLNGPFDPLDVAPPAAAPRRSLTQRQPVRPQPVPAAPAPMIAPNPTTLWNNFNRQVPMLNAQSHTYTSYQPPRMPGAFPYPPVPQPHVQSVRHMRSEPNFNPQQNVDVRVNDCVKTLKTMGYGSGNPYEATRLPIYAGAAAGDVLEAIEMLEEDRSAAKHMMV